MNTGWSVAPVSVSAPAPLSSPIVHRILHKPSTYANSS